MTTSARNNQQVHNTSTHATMGIAAMRIIIHKISVMTMVVVMGLLGSISLAQAAGDIFVWQFQHSQPGIQEAKASTVDSQGNLIITGYTNTGADDDFYTIKVSSDGQTVLWSSRYTHPQGDDWTVAVAVDGNDDVIVTGFVANGVNNDIAVIKYDGATGAQKWTAPYIFNGTANGNDIPKALAVDSLNNIYVAGYSQNGGSTSDDGLLLKLSPAGPNPDGTPIWQAHFNGTASSDDRFYTIAVGMDGIAVAGYTAVMHSGSRLDFDYLTIKFDYNGTIVWQKTYDNGTGNDLTYFTGMDLEGNVIITGEVLTGSRHDMLTIKYAAADGQQLWSTAYSGGSPNIPKGLVVDTDGETYLTGNTFTVTGKDDFYTARYAAANGAVVWEQIFDSGTDNTDIPHALAVDHSGGLYVTGYTHKAATGDDDFQTLKYNKINGNQIWQQAQDGPPVGGNEQPVGVAVALAVTADGHVYVGGWSQQAIDDLDYFAVKYNADLLNAPSSLTATVTSPTSVDLAWQDNAAIPNNEDNFCIERCQGFGCSDFLEITCAVAQDQTTYTDNTVTNDSWYAYRVTAISSSKGYSLPTTPAPALTTVINYPAPDWLYTHDGEGLDDMANAIAMSHDNNPVATGMSATATSQYNYYTVKLDRTNATTPYWISDYDGPDGQGDMGICLAVDSSDNVIVSGFSSVNSGQGFNTNDIFTIKYAATGPDLFTGDPLWTSQYSGPGNDDDRSIAVASAADGSDYSVVTGYGKNASGNDDIYLIKYKPNYDIANQAVWQITPFDRGFNDYPTAAAFTPAGDIVVVGKSERAVGDSDIFISLYRGSDGAVMSGWPYIHDFGYGIDGINAVTVASDNSIYVAGYTRNNAGNLDIYVNKFSPSGVSQWGSGKIIDGDGHGYDEAKAITIDPNDGDIVVAATVTSVSGSQDFHILRYTADGTLRWQKTLDLVTHDEQIIAMAMSPSGEICLVGETDDNVDTDIIAVKYDHLGNLIGSTKHDSGFDDYATAITVNRLGEFYISGYSATGSLAADDFDFVVFRFNGQELQAPSPLSVTPHNTSADLLWTENDSTASGYRIYRKTGSCDIGSTSFDLYNLIHTADQGTSTFTDHGLNIGSTYCYGVLTFRLGTNEVSRIIERQVTTTTPVPPDNLVATIKNTSDIEVCWHDNSASEDGFAVQRCTGVNCDFSQFTTFFAPAELDPAATSTCLVDTSACDSGSGKDFRYRVQSYKINAWSSGFNGQTGTLTVPGLIAPSGLNATRVAEAKVDLLWTDNTVDESDFMIERCQGTGCVNFAEVGTVSAVKGNSLLLEMDEAAWNGSPGQIIDYSGSGRSATAFGGATTSADAHGGRSGSLSGSNQYITSPLAIDQSAQSAGVTMMAWVKPTSTSGGQHYLFSTEDGTTGAIRNSWGLLRDAGNWSVATGEAVRSTGVAATSGQWQHVAVVFAPGSGVRFYKNGAEVLINYLGSHATSANFTIGRQGVLNQNFFDGLVDEAAVFDRALSAADIQKLYTSGVFPETTGQKWFTDPTVDANLDYQYRVTSRKQTDCGTDISTPSNVIAVTTTPLAPQPLTATLIKPGIVTLTWTPQTTTHTGFQVERCNGTGCSAFAVINNSLTASAVKLTDDTACYGSDGIIRYQIRALGAWGQSAASSVAQVSGSAGPAPAGLAVSQSTENSVKLNWTYPSATKDGFIVERCSGTQLACTQSNAFTPVAGSPLSGYDPTIQALWRMDDASWNGTTDEVVDSSGKNHPGTSKNGVVLDSPGASNSLSAALFDGINDYIETNVVLDQSSSTTGATVTAWVYPTDNSARYQYVFSTNNGGTDFGLSLNGNYWYVDTGYTTYQAQAVAFNTWQQLTVVFDPVAGVRFYVNGVKRNTYTYIDYDTSTSPLNIGRNPSTGAYFTGKIDEVAVFSKAFSDQEVSQYYNNTSAISFTDAGGVSTGGTYTYRVSSFINTACGDWGSIATPALVTASTPATAVAPDTLVVSQKSSTELGLTWHSNTSSETGFEIERCLGASCDFSSHDTFLTGAGATSYNDASVCQGQSYRYRLRAVNGTAAPWIWQTAFTTAVTKATTAASPVALTLNVVSESEIGVSWNDVNQDEDSYELARCLFVSGVTACDQPEQFSVINTFPGSINGAQLQYRMNEAVWTGAANEVQDASGNNRHGRSYNGATTVETGRFGRAGSFNGTTHYVSTTLSINQSPSSPGVTMEAWVYPTMTDGNPRSILSTENGGYDWGIIVQNGKWHVNTGLSQKDTGIAVDLNTWQHITAVFTPQSGIKFYKNDTVVDITEIDYDLMSNALAIGRNASTTSQNYFFQGQIDEVLVYARPLTVSEVTNHNTYQENTQFSHSDTSVQHSKTYYYRVTARKAAGCAWSMETTASASTPAPPAPTNLIVASSTSTSVTLNWQDNNGSETGYVVSRCEGASGGCASPVLSALSPNSQSFSDDTLCAGQTYTYRIWAEGSWGQTAFAEKETTTANMPPAPSNLTADRISEVEIAVAWNFTTADETHVTLERCAGAICVDLDLPPGATSYDDNELQPSTEYCYRVNAYKTASCGWATLAAGPVCATTSLSAGALSATPINTTSVDLAWSDTTQTETASVAERCDGDLTTCCNGDPASCNGTFTSVGVVGINQNSFTDPSACADSAYTYRVNTKGEGLSQPNGGCWSKRAPLSFTSFPAFAGVEVTIPFQSGMRADFADIRFYDATAHRELQFWVKQKTNSSTATVWLMTGANPAIFLYYGNPAASSVSGSDALFTEVYDEFQGTTINPDKWVVIDPPTDKISQDNGLKFVYKNTSSDAAVFSAKTFERAAGNELYIDFTVGADTTYANETILMGWGHDQLTAATWSGNVTHTLSLTSNSNHYMQYAYEYNTTAAYTKLLYNDLTRYQIKIVLNANSGASYYFRGGIYPDWKLLTNTATVRPDDDVMRIAFFQSSHNVTVHQVSVKHASAQRGATVNFAAAEGDGVACLTLSHTWIGVPSLAAQVLMDPATPPNTVTATASDGLVTLAWIPGTNDETEFRIERDCGSGFTQIGIAPGNTTSFQDVTMPNSTDCSYQIKGHKESPCPWTSIASDTAQVLAPPAGPAVTATATNAFQIRLDWNDSVDEEGYDIEAQIFNGAWMPIATVPANQLTYTDSHGVNPGTLYTYRVRAKRTAGNSGWSQANATTPAYTPGMATCPLP